MITPEPQQKPNSQSSIIALYPAAFAMAATANFRSSLALRRRKPGRLHAPATRPGQAKAASELKDGFNQEASG